MRNTLIIEPHSGLANRLLAFISCMRVADYYDMKFEYLWKQDKACYCEFGDLFEEFSDSSGRDLKDALTLIKNSQRIKRSQAHGIIRPHEITPLTHVRSNIFVGLPDDNRGKGFWQIGKGLKDIKRYFSVLEPREVVKSKISSVFKGVPRDDRVGVHIRWGTGDLQKHVDKFQQYGLSPYEDFIQSRIEKGKKVLIVSDSDDVIEKMSKKFYPHIVNTPVENRDKTSDLAAIQGALVDILALSRCSELISHGSSSFSFLAAILGDSLLYRIVGAEDGNAEIREFNFMSQA